MRGNMKFFTVRIIRVTNDICVFDICVAAASVSKAFIRESVVSVVVAIRSGRGRRRLRRVIRIAYFDLRRWCVLLF